MKLVSKTIKIQFEKPLSLDYIKKELEKKCANPIRWAITDIEENAATITMSEIV